MSSGIRTYITYIIVIMALVTVIIIVIVIVLVIAYMGGCQNYGPFLGPYYNTAPNI